VSTVRTAVRATAGAFGFLTRLPVGRDGNAWSAFAANPAASVVPGYVVGALAATVVLGVREAVPGLPAATVAFAYVLAVYALVGINNLDGVADCGDAAVVHGDQARRREVLGDTTTGVGRARGGRARRRGPRTGRARGRGRPGAPGGPGRRRDRGRCAGRTRRARRVRERTPRRPRGAITEETGVGTAALAVVLAVPTLAWPAVVASRVAVPVGTLASAGAFVGALAATAVVGWWAHSRLGGANGDAFGAATELARVAGLHAGCWRGRSRDVRWRRHAPRRRRRETAVRDRWATDGEPCL